MIKDKLTDLCGNSLWQNEFMNAFCGTCRVQHLGDVRSAAEDVAVGARGCLHVPTFLPS